MMKFIGILINVNHAGLLTSHPHGTPRACVTKLKRRRAEVQHVWGYEVYAVDMYGYSHLVERKPLKEEV